jgi:hypothetical protein
VTPLCGNLNIFPKPDNLAEKRTGRKMDTSSITSTPGVLQGQRVVALDCADLLDVSATVYRFASPADIRHVSLANLDAAFLAEHQPDFLILPLIAESYDATTAVALLESLSYLGRLAVLAPSLPKPRMVEAELRALGPGARLTLISA